jgi:hypothetical protein
MNADQLRQAWREGQAVRLKESYTSTAVKVVEGPFTKSPWGTAFHPASSGPYWLVKASHWREPRHVLSRQLTSQEEHDRKAAVAREERLAREAAEAAEQAREDALLDAVEAGLAMLGIDHRPYIGRGGVVLSERTAQLLADALLGEA